MANQRNVSNEVKQVVEFLDRANLSITRLNLGMAIVVGDLANDYCIAYREGKNRAQLDLILAERFQQILAALMESTKTTIDMNLPKETIH